MGVRSETPQPKPIILAYEKVNLTILRHSNGSTLVIMNDLLVKGEFPNTARTVVETEVSMEELAQAFTPTELTWMLNYQEELKKKYARN